MAEYTNQIPANIAAGDTITLTASNVTYEVLKSFQARVTVTAGKGGTGGALVVGTWGNASGGAGGQGGRVQFVWLFNAGSFLKTTIGADGNNGNSSGASAPGSGYPSGYIATSGGTSGGGGGASSLTVNDTVIAATSGGGGGGGGYATFRAQDNGMSWDWLGATNGSAGANGGVTVMPTGGTASVGTPSRITLVILSANTPPTAPASIDYGTPRAGKPIKITLTPATDPD